MSEVVVGIECDVETVPTSGRRYVRVPEAYVDAVVAAGAIPLLLPAVCDARVRQASLARVDALLVVGGNDLPPQAYGEAPIACERNSAVDARRYEAGRDLLLAALDRELPVLGVCYGLQLLNVVLGGSLVQDIALQLGGEPKTHRSGVPGIDAYHDVQVARGTRLGRAVGLERASVASQHHQAIKEVAPGLSVVARAPDGVIEAVEADDPARYVVAVQWHPERMGAGSAGWGVVLDLVREARARSAKR